MPIQLQKTASGFLGWLALKVGGRSPTEIDSALQPIIDVADNYLLQGEFDAEATVTGTFVIGNLNSSSMNFTVPAGKMWRVRAVSTDLTLGAADVAFTTSWYAFVTTNGANVAYLAAGQTFPTGNQGRVGAYYLPRPLLLTPGMIVKTAVLSSAALTQNATPHAYLLRDQFDF